MLLLLFTIPIITLLILGILSNVLKSTAYGALKFKSLNFLIKDRSFIPPLLKNITLISLFFTLFYSLYLWQFFPKIDNYLPIAFKIGKINIFELSYNLSLPFIILSSFVLIIALLTVWYMSLDVVFFCTLILLLELFLIGAFTCSSIFTFLLFFEASAIPIFILIAYCGSARRERIKASYYFLFFTLYGSLSLLLTLIILYTLVQLDFLTVVSYQLDSKLLWFLLFITFAVKIPLFPFHIWLPYAHVEASTATSIILAALMLKLGGFGLIKFMLPLFTMETHLYFRPFALIICVCGIIYASLAALRQIDLKRQVAFSSIAHMSFATAGIFTFTEVGIKGSIYLMLSHGLTSSALFFLVGVLSDRYHTRSVMAFSGLLTTMPLFSFFFVLATLANVGFPGTSGFLPELLILVGIVSSSLSILFGILIGMLLTTASALIVMLRLLFGHIKTFYVKSSWIDLTKLEFTILSVLSIWIIILGLYDILQIY